MGTKIKKRYKMNTGLFVALLVIGSACAAPVQPKINELQDKQFVSWILNTFNLGGIWEVIQNLGGNVAGQFTSLMTSLFWAGGSAISAVRPILADLVSQVTSNPGQAAQLVQNALPIIQGIIAASGKREVEDIKQKMDKQIITNFILNTLGLGNIWSNITALGSGVVANLTALLTDVFWGGASVIFAVRPILTQLAQAVAANPSNAAALVQEAIANVQAVVNSNKIIEKQIITNFILNTLGLGNIWSNITALGSGVVANLTALLTDVFWGGASVIFAVRPILTQLAQAVAANPS